MPRVVRVGMVDGALITAIAEPDHSVPSMLVTLNIGEILHHSYMEKIRELVSD